MIYIKKHQKVKAVPNFSKMFGDGLFDPILWVVQEDTKLTKPIHQHAIIASWDSIIMNSEQCIHDFS